MVRPLALSLLVLVASPGAARANGLYTHVHISQLAVHELPPGPLRDLLADPENLAACEAGSMFPDSGYAAGSPYGEAAHWEPFVVAYAADLRARHGGDYGSPAAQREVAFLLGAASHGMADQSYDTTLLLREFEVDGPENEDFPVDQYADYFLVVDEEVSFTVEPWAPYPELAAFISAVAGGAVSEADMMEGMRLASVVTTAQSTPSIARGGYWHAWEHYPWLGTHVYNEAAVGSVTWLAGLVALYWEVLWRRLHATDDPDEDLVIATVPEDGAVNFPVSTSESVALGRIAVWFGYGVDRDAVTPLLRLRDEGGAEVPVDYATAYGGRERSLVFLVPQAPLAYDAVYTIEVGEGVPTLSGETSTRPFLSSFRTRCAPERLADCPPLDPPLVTGPIPMRPAPSDAGADAGEDAGTDAGVPPADAGTTGGGGGCSVASPPASPALLLALALLVLRRRR